MSIHATKVQRMNYPKYPCHHKSICQLGSKCNYAATSLMSEDVLLQSIGPEKFENLVNRRNPHCLKQMVG
jgi:hypothetical protein